MRKRLVVPIIFFSFLFLLVSPTLAQIIFSDDFSGDMSKWTAVEGTWVIEGGELSGDNDVGSTARLKIMTLASFSGYSCRILEAKVVLKGWYECEHGAAYSRIGIIIQMNPSSLYHDWCLVIRGDNRLCLLDEGVTWGSSTSFTPVVDTVYRMKMMYDGTDIKGKCWVDGDPEPDWQLSVQWTDTVSDARVGLYAAFVHAHFDDVTVNDPNGNVEPPSSAPEFGVELSAVTSIAVAAYMLVKQRMFKKKE